MAEEKTPNENVSSDQPKELPKIPENQNHTTRIVVLVVVLVLVAVGLAVAVKFSAFHRRSNNFGRFEVMRNVEPRGGMMGQGRMMEGFGRGFAENGNLGISGTITNISGDKLIVKTSDKDQTVDITDTTSIIKGKEIAAKSDLANNDTVTVRGTSNSAGELVATFITVK